MKVYLKNICSVALRGDAREESYYSTLEALLHETSEALGKENIEITTLPKKTKAGNPDFRIWDGRQKIVGYIEAKKPTYDDLDAIEDTEQLKRYINTFPNVILTNFLEFRLYRDSKLTDTAIIARPVILEKLETTPPVENEPELMRLLDKFYSFSILPVYDAESLAEELAKRTSFLRDEVIARQLEEETRDGKGDILGFYRAFREYLIGGLTNAQFADLYSQTITYGLFAARMRSDNEFNRKLAYDRIPHSIGILRDVFEFISLGDLPKGMECILDDISEVFAVTDVNNILRQYFHDGKGSDPIIHFYETFLAVYNPKLREKRGVYYTPEPIVSYIVRSLNHILKETFDKADGFASESVTVLDPAAGTLTFMAEAAKLAVTEFTSKYGEGSKGDFIKRHVLENFYAFELMMAPYAVGHLKMSFLLEELGYRLHEHDRFKLYLTNSLEVEELSQINIPGLASLSKESHAAERVKNEQPILVILGNPPYSGHSANASIRTVKVRVKNGKERLRKVKTWIGNLIDHYKFVDGKPLGEKNPKWLQDDYVKFIRFAQWKIDQAGEGVVGFVTNHSYLDNPTFRGMRQSLMNSFNKIYILDLHGSAKKKEKCPDGSKDENLFDIQQGVAIVLMVKEKKRKKGCAVRHLDLWGVRDAKRAWLLENDLTTSKWKKLSPASESYFFVPRDEKLLVKYQGYPKITDIFPVSSVGIVTARDKLTIKWTPEEVWTTILNFSRMDPELARATFKLGEDAKDWKVEQAQKDVRDSGPEKKRIIPIMYRPFDIRYTYYTGQSGGFHCRPRYEVMRHMLPENIGLCVGRQWDVTGSPIYDIAFITGNMIDLNLFRRGGELLFPLLLNADTQNHDFLNPQGGKKPNIQSSFVANLGKAYGRRPVPARVFYYVYGILYSNSYRTRYTEFLKKDFPRIPFTNDRKLFSLMAKLGDRLVKLHLLKSRELDTPVAKFPVKGDGKVEKPVYDYENKRVYINKEQYFDGVKSEVLGYKIGGYQVCEKWLKDRKGRKLSVNEVKHYCKVVTALQITIEVQKEIDELYHGVEKGTIDFQHV